MLQNSPERNVLCESLRSMGTKFVSCEFVLGKQLQFPDITEPWQVLLLFFS